MLVPNTTSEPPSIAYLTRSCGILSFESHWRSHGELLRGVRIFCIFHSEVCVIPEWLLEVKGTESDANLQSMASGRNKVILNKFVNARHDWVDCHIII